MFITVRDLFMVANGANPTTAALAPVTTGTAIKTLQDAVKAAPDGVIGPLTLQAIKDANPIQLSARFNGARLLFMAGLPTWPSFGRGWARRIANNLLGG